MPLACWLVRAARLALAPNLFQLYPVIWKVLSEDSMIPLPGLSFYIKKCPLHLSVLFWASPWIDSQHLQHMQCPVGWLVDIPSNPSSIHRCINKIAIHVMSQTVILLNRKVTCIPSFSFLIKHRVHTSSERGRAEKRESLRAGSGRWCRRVYECNSNIAFSTLALTVNLDRIRIFGGGVPCSRRSALS